ncbi:hypothetical protein K456DRAFT_138757 [Colletotrichum gloeosporioides 23]|nr:hypothetical protein K456DRAFT_138757 [Colletotrichum gloeosporioides 23]
MKKCRVSAGSPSPWHAESRMCGAVLGSKRRVASQLAGGGRSGTGYNRGGFAFWARCLGFCQTFCHGILGLMAPACCSPRRHPRNLGAGRRGERDGHRLRYTSTKSSLFLCPSCLAPGVGPRSLATLPILLVSPPHSPHTRILAWGSAGSGPTLSVPLTVKPRRG